MVAIYHITTSMKNKLNISTSKVRGDFSTRFVGITQLFSFNRISVSAFTHTDIEEFIFKILPTSYRIFFFFFLFSFVCVSENIFPFEIWNPSFVDDCCHGSKMNE